MSKNSITERGLNEISFDQEAVFARLVEIKKLGIPIEDTKVRQGTSIAIQRVYFRRVYGITEDFYAENSPYIKDLNLLKKWYWDNVLHHLILVKDELALRQTNLVSGFINKAANEHFLLILQTWIYLFVLESKNKINSDSPIQFKETKEDTLYSLIYEAKEITIKELFWAKKEVIESLSSLYPRYKNVEGAKHLAQKVTERGNLYEFLYLALHFEQKSERELLNFVTNMLYEATIKDQHNKPNPYFSSLKIEFKKSILFIDESISIIDGKIKNIAEKSADFRYFEPLLISTTMILFPEGLRGSNILAEYCAHFSKEKIKNSLSDWLHITAQVVGYSALFLTGLGWAGIIARMSIWLTRIVSISPYVIEGLATAARISEQEGYNSIKKVQRLNILHEVIYRKAEKDPIQNFLIGCYTDILFDKFLDGISEGLKGYLSYRKASGLIAKWTDNVSESATVRGLYESSIEELNVEKAFDDMIFPGTEQNMFRFRKKSNNPKVSEIWDEKTKKYITVENTQSIIFNPVSGKPKLTTSYEARTTFTEHTLAFEKYRFEDGWILLDGPSGKAGHPWNKGGFDGVAFKPGKDFVLHIFDNKALSEKGNVSSVTAMNENILQNIDKQLEIAYNPELDKILPEITQIRTALKSARKSIIDFNRGLTANVELPDNVRLLIYNLGGKSTGVSKKLSKLGIEFIEAN